MARRRFDPTKAMGGEEPQTPARREAKLFGHVAEAAQLTVTQVAELIKNTLEQRIPSPLRVIGQVSNLSTANHWYFSLKDENAVLGCVAWASAAKKFGFTPRDGDEVVATGHVSHYGPQGRTQLYVSDLKPVGAGALDLRFRAMCEELRKLGYFEEARKKPLPTFPRRIAVITSATSAAVRDVIVTAAQRCKAVGLIIVDVRVQGDGAAEDVARAIRWVDANHLKLGVDAILVTRGGGSIEDLWAFNERVVADAVYSCSIPLVAAIGHESDTTVIELVADLRAATPTQAAMRLVPAASELHRQLHHLEDRLQLLLRRSIDRRRDLLLRLARHEALRDPGAIVRRANETLQRMTIDLMRVIRNRAANERLRVEQFGRQLERSRPIELLARRRELIAVLDQRLGAAVHHHVRLTRQKLEALERQLVAIGPQQVLRRGYSVTEDEAGRLVVSIRDVRSGQMILTHVSDGRIESIVGNAKPQSGKERANTGREVRKHRGGSDQMDLFDSRR